MTIDNTGRAHKPAGSPASTGGQFATQAAPGAASAQLADEQASHAAEQQRIDRALGRLGTSRDELVELFHDHANRAEVDGIVGVDPGLVAQSIADRFGPDVVHPAQLEQALVDPTNELWEPSGEHDDYDLGAEATVAFLAGYLSKPRPVTSPDDEKPQSWDGSGHVVGAEYQIGQIHDIRRTWATGNPERPFVTYTDQYVVTARDGEGNELGEDDVARIKQEQASWDAERDEQDEPENWADKNTRPTVQFAYEDGLETIEHRERDDVGGTEIASDYSRGEGSYRSYDTFEQAEQELKRDMARLDWGMYSLDDFNPEKD